MCYRPLHLPNNSLKFDLDHDRLFHNVPCGNCGECRQRKQDQAAARLYYQYLKTEETVIPGFYYTSPDGKVDIHEHGYTYLQTFTYNEELCPWLHGIRCFRPDDYRSFMANLRNDMRSLGYYDNYDPDSGNEPPIKVYWVSEFGGETYRPHYHALFFIACPMDPEKFEELCQRNWAIVTKYSCKGSERVSLGWTDISNPYDSTHTHPSQLVVDGHVAVMNYVSNYIGKDIEFEEVLKNQKGSHYDELPISRDDYKFLHPFTRQSKGIGICIKDILSIDELMDGRMTIPDTREGTKVIALPLYIDRHVFYDYDPEDKCFRLNDIGYQMKEHRLEHNRGYVKKQLNFLYSNILCLWNEHSEAMISWFAKNHEQYSTPMEAVALVSDVINNRLDDLVDYVIYYKDIVSTYTNEVDSGVNLREFACDHIVKYTAPDPIYTFSIDSIDKVDYQIMINHTYGKCCDRFKGFDEILAIFNGINMAFCHSQQLDFLRRRAERARQKKVYKMFHSLNRF